MDHYDEKMNYSFEPVAPETPQPPLEQAKEEIRRSGKHTGLKIAALLAAVAIVAGVGGSALTKAIDAIGQKNLAEQESSASVGAMAEQSVEQEQPAAQKPQAAPSTAREVPTMASYPSARAKAMVMGTKTTFSSDMPKVAPPMAKIST